MWGLKAAAASFFIPPHCVVCGILVTWPGIETRPLAVKASWLTTGPQGIPGECDASALIRNYLQGLEISKYNMLMICICLNSAKEWLKEVNKYFTWELQKTYSIF